MTKDGCTIVGDGSTKLEVESRVKQINRLMEDAEAQYEIEKLSERVARLSGGVAVIQVGARTHSFPFEGPLPALLLVGHSAPPNAGGTQHISSIPIGVTIRNLLTVCLPICLPLSVSGGRADGDGAEGEEAACGGCAQRNEGGGG